MSPNPLNTHRLNLALLACSLVGTLVPLHAEEARDPTRPPPEVASLPSAPGESKPGLPLSPGDLSIVVVDGKPLLVRDKHLYRQGESLGQYKIERISESEVWLRKGRELHKIARFAGIERRSLAPERSNP
jgi:hypothetical protein